ncbi:hypothetical protein V500_10769 [Pseudogymnoascus sp. VKM F-4518 (FW-2643)]|nr:hypothetical protein V500_10769 [Pseudogymnoascus sp. VKM F-4518 (FW-2643)]
MAPEHSPSNRLLQEDRQENIVGITDDGDTAVEPPTKRRRVFLQTMGQQLREVGALQTSPREIATSFAGSTGDASHIQSLNETPKIGGSQHGNVQTQTPESDAVPGMDDQPLTGALMSASKSLWLPGEVLTVVTDSSDTFTFDDLLSWTCSYFDNWHPAYPFLHAPSVLEHFGHVIDHGVLDSTDSLKHKLTILRSIMSVSLIDRRQTAAVMRPVPKQLVFASLNDAIQSVQCMLTDESSIPALQAIVSVQLLFISMLRYNAASRLQGLAVRMAFHLGLHRCPMQFSAFPREEARLRQRIFWSIYCIDRYISIRLGVPLAIRDTDIDACFPTLERHLEGIQSQPDNDGRLDLLGFLARHAEIRGSITELRNKSVLYKQTEVDDAIVIDAKLSKWWNEVDEYLESSSSGTLPISRYHQVTLVVLRHESIIALNKYTVATSKKGSVYDAALQNCISAARCIISTLHKALGRQNINITGAQEAPETCGLLWPSFTWAVWMSAFIMIYAAKEGQVPQNVATRLVDRALEVLEHLTLRGSVWPNACAIAIRDLRAQLIDKRIHSKQAHSNSSNMSRNDQSGNIPSGSIPRRSDSDNDFYGASNNSTRWHDPHTSRAGRPYSHGNHRMLPPGQDTGSSRDISSIQEDPGQSFSNDMSSANFSGVPQPPASPQNRVFSELIPSFRDAEGNGYVYRMGAELGLDLQMPNQDSAELFYGLDTPFWLNDDQWRGLDENN